MSFIDAHTHKNGSNDFSLVNISLTDDLINLPSLFSIGIHPWDVTSNLEIRELERYVQDIRCIAVGETGLDRSEKYISSLDYQTKVFVEHITLSIKFNKPLIIHCVRAYSDILEQLKKYSL